MRAIYQQPQFRGQEWVFFLDAVRVNRQGLPGVRVGIDPEGKVDGIRLGPAIAVDVPTVHLDGVLVPGSLEDQIPPPVVTALAVATVN